MLTAITSLLALASPLAAVQSGAPRPTEVHPQRLLVELRADLSPTALEEAHLLAGGRVLVELRQIGWQVVEVPAGRLRSARAAYLATGAFERVEFDHRKRLAYDPNDPMWSMWHMQKIRADLAWDTHKGGPTVVVGILDTGLEVTHPDLAANVWNNPGEIPNNGLDDDANGYVDDVVGYDFAYLDNDPDDVFGHGTSCAGIVAAVQDNGIGVTGVAPQCLVAGLKAATDSGYLYDSAVVPGLLYAADMGFQVVSMSFYSDAVTPAEGAAIEYCWSKNVLPVAAAGNDSQVLPYYPGAWENTLSVAATTQSDAKASFSNYGSWVDVGAPGVGLSTCSKGGGYTTGFAGTSGACPHAAGVAALLFAAKPGATNAEVRAAIEDTASPLVSATLGEYTNSGLIDCKGALDRLLGATSGSRAPRLLFANPVAGGAPPVWFQTAKGTVVRGDLKLYGVGLEAPNVVRVLRGGVPLPILEQTRNWVVVPAANVNALVELEVNGAVVDSFQSGTFDGYVYAPSDAGTKGSGSPVVTGGFAELAHADGKVLTCTRKSGQTIFTQYVFRLVEAAPVHSLELVYTRGYDNTSGTETIRMYDWQSGSYPYGNWVDLATTPVSGSSTQSISALIATNPGRFLDDAGSVYVEVTTTGAASGAQVRADALNLRVR